MSGFDLPKAGTAFLLLLLLALAGCSSPVSPQQDYEWHCLGCHGAHGEGAWGPNIQGLKRTDQQIIDVITNGQGKMPAFKGHLTEREMRDLAEYVKTFPYKG